MKKLLFYRDSIFNVSTRKRVSVSVPELDELKLTKAFKRQVESVIILDDFRSKEARKVLKDRDSKTKTNYKNIKEIKDLSKFYSADEIKFIESFNITDYKISTFKK